MIFDFRSYWYIICGLWVLQLVYSKLNRVEACEAPFVIQDTPNSSHSRLTSEFAGTEFDRSFLPAVFSENDSRFTLLLEREIEIQEDAPVPEEISLNANLEDASSPSELVSTTPSSLERTLTVPSSYVSLASTPILLVQGPHITTLREIDDSCTDAIDHSSLAIQQKKGKDDDMEGHNETEFLPFDEWKKLKLGEMQGNINGDSDITQEHSNYFIKGKDPAPQSIRSRNIVDYNKMDSVGDDMEIDVGMFTNSLDDDEPEGKLYQKKFNYASLDCAASIVKSNSEAQGASSILYENKDKYLLNPCSASVKFVVIELCQDILVEDIAMANFEFFSSTFERVRFSVSDRFPVQKNAWKILGEYVADNTRDLQTFRIPNPMIWARYLRIEILSHYGEEFYCPISLVRAHGKTMMDEFKMTQKEDETNALSIQEKEKDTQDIPINASTSPVPCNITNYNEFFDRYQNPLVFSNNNTMELFWDYSTSQCRAALPPLKFDEFIKDFNGSGYTTTRQAKSMDFTSNTISPSLSIEESIFKNIVKRLGTLEANATLSILYIEEQSRLLSNSFSSLEKTHARKFDSLVAAFNETIMTNLDTLSVFARQLRESSLKILEEQKLANDQFTSLTLKRLDIMEKEAKSQKRMMFVVLFGFFGLIVYVLLTREAYIDDYMEDDGWYLESPPLQKAKNNLIKKASRAVSTPTIFKHFFLDDDDIDGNNSGKRSFSTSSSSIASSSSQDIRNNDDDSNIFTNRSRSYSKLLRADEKAIDIDEIMTASSDNSEASNDMDDGILDMDTTELSSRESSDRETNNK